MAAWGDALLMLQWHVGVARLGPLGRWKTEPARVLASGADGAALGQPPHAAEHKLATQCWLHASC